jgi:hypothetical protein
VDARGRHRGISRPDAPLDAAPCVGVDRPIPAGFILVVDQVTGFINLPPTQIVPHQQANLANSNYWVFNEQVTLYSTSPINLFFSRNDDQGLIATDGSAGIRWTLIGHLVADA